MNLDQLTEEVWKRLQNDQPRALLVGNRPDGLDRFQLVQELPYDAVILGILPPADLLHMPSQIVCEALLQDIPVYLWEAQPYRSAKNARALCRALAAAEQSLLQLGVRRLGVCKKLITAQEARMLLRMGRKPQPGARMTPLARDILEGKET